MLTQHTAKHCNTLQHTATHQNRADSCPGLLQFAHNTLQHTATHCNTLQHPAPHCNKRQHTGTERTHARRHFNVKGRQDFCRQPLARCILSHISCGVCCGVCCSVCCSQLARCILSHISHTYIRMNESCHTYEWVMSHALHTVTNQLRSVLRSVLQCVLQSACALHTVTYQSHIYTYE